MESKPGVVCYCSISGCLLIEPVWNRNRHYCMTSCCSISFNRTSMESKPTPKQTSIESPCLTFNRTSMESKPAQRHLRKALWCPFNRTSMESKQFRDAVGFPCRQILLIEPVWNRNSEESVQNACPLQSFNRTSMESKPLGNL